MQPTLEIDTEDWFWDSPMEEDEEEDKEEDEEDEGLPPMQHQALAHRPLPEMDYDWEPPLTVIPESENVYDELVRI